MSLDRGFPVIQNASLSNPSVSSGSVAHDEIDSSLSSGPLPRPVRKRRRPKEDRGLPPDEQLKTLARVYLQTQRTI